MTQISFHTPSLWLSMPREDLRLYLHKIRYIETDKRRLLFHYGNEVIYYHGSLHDFEKKLIKHGFFRCNTSFIVNTQYIRKITKDINRYNVFLITGEVLPLSRDKRKQLMEMLMAMD